MTRIGSMIRSACVAAFLVLAMASVSLAGEQGDGRAKVQTRPARIDVRLFDLAAVRRLFHVLARRGNAMGEGERAAALADLSVMTEAVIGGSPGELLTFDELVRAASHENGPHVSAAPGVRGRDEAA